MFVLGHIVLLTVLFAGVGGVSICPIHATPSHPIRLHGDACYQFHLRESRDFSAAQAECRSQGGSEVIIRDSDTQRFLFDAIEREFHYRGVVWIGLNDVAKEGTFIWVDGSPMTFSFWAPGQPGFFGSLEDCVVMDMRDGGHWHDYLCEYFLFIKAPHPFICQFPLQYIGSTPTWRPWDTTKLTTLTTEHTVTMPPDVSMTTSPDNTVSMTTVTGSTEVHAVTMHPDVSMTTSPDTTVSMTTVTGSTEVHAVTMHPDVSVTTSPDTTVSMTTVTGSTEASASTASMTTVPKTTVPMTTVPESTVPVTTVPKTTVPKTTVPESTVPVTTVPMTTVPDSTVPVTTVPMTTVPDSTVPVTTIPVTTVPVTTVPMTTVPDSTVPVTTVPKTTVPMTTVPESTVPVTTAPKSTVPFKRQLFP